MKGRQIRVVRGMRAETEVGVMQGRDHKPQNAVKKVMEILSTHKEYSQ